MIMFSLTTNVKIVAGFVWYRTTPIDVAHAFFTRINVGALMHNCWTKKSYSLWNMGWKLICTRCKVHGDSTFYMGFFKYIYIMSKVLNRNRLDIFWKISICYNEVKTIVYFSLESYNNNRKWCCRPLVVNPFIERCNNVHMKKCKL